MKAKLADIIQIMETIAPEHLAESWDNVGLQVGEPSWRIKKIWIALDPTPDVVSAACDNNVNLLITHHPLLFNGLKKIDFSHPVGKIIQLAGMHQLAIFSAHTNLDNAHHGLNDILADKIGLDNVTILKRSNADAMYKLALSIPKNIEEKILGTLIELNGKETNTLARSLIMCDAHKIQIEGDKPKASENVSNRILRKEAVQIETDVCKNELPNVIGHILKMHEEEIISYDILPNLFQDANTGTGRIGDVKENVRLSSFAEHLSRQFGTSLVKVTGEPDLLINRVAVCSGSGASMIPDFVSSGAQVFVTGDLKYHDARVIEQAGLGAVDIGHFASECIVIDELKNRLQKIVSDKQINARIESCDIERDPFWSPEHR